MFGDRLDHLPGALQCGGALGRIGLGRECEQGVEDLHKLGSGLAAQGVVVHRQRVDLPFELAQPLLALFPLIPTDGRLQSMNWRMLVILGICCCAIPAGRGSNLESCLDAGLLSRACKILFSSRGGQ